jgi:hypothetical protein
MKLTPNQKELLACIKDKKIRKEVKKEFKKRPTFYYTRWKLLDEPIVGPKNDEFKIDDSKFADLLSNHPMNGVLFKDEFEKAFGEGFPWYEMESKKVEEKFDELANEFNIKEKAIEILSDKKHKESQEKFFEEFANYKPTNPTHFNNDYTNHIEEKNHLCWIYNRLINYGEGPLFDYMHKLKEIALNFSEKKKYTEEDMRKCFEASKKQEIVGTEVLLKYNNFEHYIQSLKNPS